MVKNLSLKEKIDLFNQEAYNSKNADDTKEKLRNGELGSIILATSSTAGNDKQVTSSAEILNEFKRVSIEESRSKIPVIIGRDIIHGHKTRGGCGHILGLRRE